jgi:predicted Zn finger-like uncharacterized protein
MVSPLTSIVVIECPHCGTRYQLPSEAIGPRGRQVACAHCGQTWQAKAVGVPEPRDDDRMFDAAAEQALDEAFEAAEQSDRREPEPAAETSMKSIAEIAAAIAPKPKKPEPKSDTMPDPAGEQTRERAFSRRQAAMARRSPMGRVRRSIRVAAVTFLLALIGCGVAFRTEIVRQFPDLAGAYAALGLGVNVVGLEFRDVTTLVTLRGGSRFMQVDARIYSVAARNVKLPPVVVTLLDANDTPLYQWSVAPAAEALNPGEVVDFSAQLNAPPLAATQVRLTFIDGKAPAVGTVVTPKATGS